MRTYNAVKASPDEVFAQISRWTVDKESYYEVRRLEADTDVVAAAQFIYLNKTGWNGLYRVNRQGKFNVPYGLPKSSNVTPLATLQAASAALQHASISHGDFENSLSSAVAGDLVFVDPPYVTSHNNNGFIEYNEKLFSWDDQVRLAALCTRLAEAGVHIIATNAAHDAVRALYRDFRVTEFSRYSTLAGKSENRRTVSELIFSTDSASRD